MCKLVFRCIVIKLKPDISVVKFVLFIVSGKWLSSIYFQHEFSAITVSDTFICNVYFVIMLYSGLPNYYGHITQSKYYDFNSNPIYHNINIM